MITVFGSINLDYIGNVQALPLPGETVKGDDLLIAPGGKGANQALAAARAGSTVRLVGSVGDDMAAEEVLRLLRTDGVDLRHVEVGDRHTGTALILVDDGGENVIAILPGANANTASADLAKARIEPGETVMFQMELNVNETMDAIRAARAVGARTIVNLAPYTDLPDTIWPSIDIVIVNETEGRALASLPEDAADEDIVRALGEMPSLASTTVVATFGANGAVTIDAGDVSSFPVQPIEVVDSVGAGDTFCGYLAAWLDQGGTLSEAMAVAVRAGALACTTRGAQPSIPHESMVSAYRGHL